MQIVRQNRSDPKAVRFFASASSLAYLGTALLFFFPLLYFNFPGCLALMPSLMECTLILIVLSPLHSAVDPLPLGLI
jgi:hypothetical protein